MKVDTTQQLLAFDRTVARDQDGVPVTLQWAIQNAVNTPLNSEPWTPASLMQCGRIAQAAYPQDGEPVEFSATDRSFILRRSEKMCAEGRSTALMHMRLVELLEDPEVSTIDDTDA